MADKDETIEVKKGFFQEMFGELLNAVKKNAEEDKEEDKKEDEPKENAEDQEVQVGDEKMPLKELINKYVSLTNKKNAEGEDKKEEDEDKKENSDDEDEDDKKETKENSKGVDHFEELRNAHMKYSPQLHATLETPMDQTARGKARYGSV